MAEFKARDITVDANRAAVFSLDCTASHLTDLFKYVFEETTRAERRNHVTTIALQALRARKRAAVRTDPKITDPTILAVCSALAALRVERADPFREYPPSKTNDVTRRRTRPLHRNPGLSRPAQYIRDYYVNTILGYTTTNHQVAHDAATLLYALQAPRRDSLPDDELRAYADLPHTQIEEATHTVTVTDDDVRLPEALASRRCQAPHNAFTASRTPPLQRTDGQLSIPAVAFRAKLRAYLSFSFDRLLYIAFHIVTPHVIEDLKRSTQDITDRLRKKDETGHITDLYAPFYTVTGTHPGETQHNPPSLPDPRLIGIVDTIRATPSLSFSAYHSPNAIAAAARNYLPPPHRPSLPRLTPARIRGVLTETATTDPAQSAPNHYSDTPTTTVTTTDTPSCTDVVRSRSTNTGLEFRIREPPYTPLYTPPNTPITHPWDAYKHLLYEQATQDLPANHTITAAHDAEELTIHDSLNTALRDAHTAAATTPHTTPLEHVQPHVTPRMLNSDSQLDKDDLTFLTRIAKGMHHLLDDVTIHDGMAAYDTDLTVDIPALKHDGWLNTYSEPRVTLYNVPSDRLRDIGLRPLHQEGYSDTVFENALHKYTVDHLRRELERRPDVTTTHAYYDLWRLEIDNDRLTDIITTSERIATDRDNFTAKDFHRARADVVAFQDDTLTHIGEAHTTCQNKHAPARNWDTLAILGHPDINIETHWCFPSGLHATDTLKKLCQTNRINAPPSILNSTRSPSECQNFLTTHDSTNPGINQVHGIRSN